MMYINWQKEKTNIFFFSVEARIRKIAKEEGESMRWRTLLSSLPRVVRQAKLEI